ncbi:MAG: DUF1566 domain-containing protein [Candidatus Scalindua sp.]|nr:DUF1566 domain-containing protein [Candidatus Scalindua sp.]
MRKQLLRTLIISFVLLSMPVIYAAEVPHITIRSSYTDISVPQIQSIPNVVIDKKEDWGFWGHSTIIHHYDLKSIKADKVVIDHATGLMWHQSGSEKYMNWKLANSWVEQLNEKGYAGFNDWRLPTVEEAFSLLETSKKNGNLYIDHAFDIKQQWIWTGDKMSGLEAAWVVAFYDSNVCWYAFTSRYHYVRPVRSIK